MAQKGYYIGYDRGSDWRGNDERKTHVACQKVVVDWILTCAKPFVEKIPLISLTGFIKNSTKARWDEIFEDERKGMHRDMSDEREVIKTWLFTEL